ncbi:MAG: VWA domain-containing protein [Anaerolineae bacterium]|nr:VWA domain-containing protein [Anaerolineae bacterium]
MRRSLLAALLILAILPVTLAATQEAREPRLEITGLNPINLPTVSVSVNVFDQVGQPVPDLTAADFRVTGELADRARVVSVRSFSDAAIPINVVLAMDVSSSMAETPIDNAKLAANTFVESIGANDPVALVVFSTGARLSRAFTTDKAALISAINNLGVGGETYLFDGALEAIQQAVAAGNPRRAVILLSDGAQYDTANRSAATEQDVLNAAVNNGVPVYTIGLGFGADRHYLENLSTETNGLFRESPTPAELQAIYTELADLLRTQYEVVLQVDVPLDGTTYDLGLEVTTPEGIASSTGRLRAPVPVPVVRAPELPAVIDRVTEAVAEVVADDALTGVEIALDGTAQVTLTEAPFGFTIDPVALAPGAHSLTYTATDEHGDTGAATVDFSIAALPSDIRIDPPLSGTIGDLQVYSVDITGQTDAVSVNLTQDGGEPLALPEPYTFVIDPFTLTPGDHVIGITVTNAGGVTTGIGGQFAVPELPIQFTVTGLESGQQVAEPVQIGVDVLSSQGEVTDVTFAFNGEPLNAADANTLVLDPQSLPPGPGTLSVTVGNALGQTTTQSLSIQVTALPPTVTLSGLESGETLDADRTIEIITTSQTPVTDIRAQVDGQTLEVTPGEPATTVLDVLAIGPGAHTLSITAANQAGLEAQVEIAFTVPESVSLTATAQVPPTETVTPEVPATTVSASETAVSAATEEATSTETAATTEAEAQALQTETSAAINQAATAAIAGLFERITETAQAQGQASATPTTAVAVTESATADLAATSDAQATIDGAATSAAQAVIEGTATSDAQATADLAATVNAQSTLDAAGTATTTAAVTEEAAVESATPTLSDQDLNATLDAASSSAVSALIERITATAAVSASAAAAAQVTLDAQMTADAALTATQSAVQAQATSAAEGTESALQTATQLFMDAQATASQSVLDEQMTADAATTENAAQTATQSALDEQMTADAEGTDSAAQTATQAAADEQATADAQSTIDAAATSDAQVTVTAERTPEVEPTEEVTGEVNVVPTEAGTEVAQEATRASATPTTGGANASPAASVTPIGTLIPAQAESTPGNETMIPVAVIVVVIVVVLFLLYILLSRSRRTRR